MGSKATNLVPGGANGVFIVIKVPIEMCFCQQLWISLRIFEEVNGDACLRDWFSPNMEGEVTISSCQDGDEVVFECADLSFRHISSMVSWWHYLPVDVVAVHFILQSLRCLVV